MELNHYLNQLAQQKGYNNFSEYSRFNNVNRVKELIIEASELYGQSEYKRGYEDGIAKQVDIYYKN